MNNNFTTEEVLNAVKEELFEVYGPLSNNDKSYTIIGVVVSALSRKVNVKEEQESETYKIWWEQEGKESFGHWRKINN